MITRVDITRWIRRQVRGLGSLAAATGIVVGVMAFATFSLMTPAAHEAEPGLSTTTSVSGNVQVAFDAAGKTMPSLYVEALLDSPIALTADIDVHGWRDRGHRIVDTEISSVEAFEQDSGAVKRAAAYPAGQITQQLKGQRVLASVSESAAEQLPASGRAKVSLVVTPKGETATLVIDQVISPESKSGVRVAATGSAVGAAYVAGPVAQASVTAAATTKVTELSRYWGPVGTKVTMTGTGFGRTQGTSWVTCAGSKARILSWSNTKITFRVPTGMTKQGYIGVVRRKVTSNGMFYIPFSLPVITGITPQEGAPGTVVTLTGSGFGSKQADGWVTFSGSTAQVVSWSNTKVKVIVPRDAATGWAGIVAHGMTSNGVLYGPLGMPVVDGVSAKVLLPDRQVSITGRSFGNQPGTVIVGGVRIAPDYWSPTEVRFTVSRSLTAGGYVGVIRSDSWTSNGKWRSWAPRVVSVSHWWSRPNGEITLTGIGFGAQQGDKRVFLRGTELSVKSWSASQIVAYVPSSETAGYVGVGTSSACSNGVYHLVTKPATITTVSSRAVRGGDRLTIQGADFGTACDTSAVLVGGKPCEVVSWGETLIVVTVPTLTNTSYVGVVKCGVSSNGYWVTPVAGD